jgi:predicted ATP-grasp superfamily ATP-dependent carboligase
MKKILILQPYLDQSMAIAKFLRRFSSEFYIIAGLIDEQPSRIPNRIYHETKKINYEDLIINNQYDLILPTGSHGTKSLLSLTESITIGKIIFKRENLTMFDKKLSLSLIEKLGIPFPKTYKNINQIEEYPIFYKQAFECGGGKRGIAYSQEELNSIALNEKLIFQEYIISPETYGVGFLARDGQLITYFIHKEIMSFPKTGGSGIVLTKYQDDQLLFYTRKILDSFNYSGWGLVEFKYCNKRKDFVFMEVNAKMWASIEFALLNNPVFFKELFNIQYNPKKGINCIIFLNRLAQYGLKEYLTVQAFYKKCYKLNFWQSFSILILNTISLTLKAIIKKAFH